MVFRGTHNLLPAYNVPKSKYYHFTFPDITYEAKDNIVITNSPNKLKIMMINDSYGAYMDPFINATFFQIYWNPIHINYYSEVIKYTVEKSMIDFKPDIVILQYGQRVIGEHWPL